MAELVAEAEAAAAGRRGRSRPRPRSGARPRRPAPRPSAGNRSCGRDRGGEGICGGRTRARARRGGGGAARGARRAGRPPRRDPRGAAAGAAAGPARRPRGEREGGQRDRRLGAAADRAAGPSALSRRLDEPLPLAAPLAPGDPVVAPDDRGPRHDRRDRRRRGDRARQRRAARQVPLDRLQPSREPAAPTRRRGRPYRARNGAERHPRRARPARPHGAGGPRGGPRPRRPGGARGPRRGAGDPRPRNRSRAEGRPRRARAAPARRGASVRFGRRRDRRPPRRRGSCQVRAGEAEASPKKDGHDLLRCPYPGKFVPTPATTTPDVVREHATLEILWQQDVSATVFTRAPDGSLSAGSLLVGIPAVSDLADLGQGATGRRVGLSRAARIRSGSSRRPRAGGSARATFAILELAQRSVTEGLVHPQLQHGGRTWLALLGRDDRRRRPGGTRRDRSGAAGRLHGCVRR